MHTLRIIYINVKIIVCVLQLTIAADGSNCSCGVYKEHAWAGPYCRKWNPSFYSFCYLSGRENAKHCSGAMQVGNSSIYWTRDERICDKSKTWPIDNCNCGNYETFRKGPYCAKWHPGHPNMSYCLLSGGDNVGYCPRATWIGHLNGTSLFLTKDEYTCNKSRRWLQNCNCGSYKNYHVGPYC